MALPQGTEGEFFAADYKFLQNQLPPNNYSIGGSISLYGNPVVSLSEDQAGVFLADIHRLRDRMGESGNRFYRELMGSLSLTMMYDIFSFHSGRAGFIVYELMRLLAGGKLLHGTKRPLVREEAQRFREIPILYGETADGEFRHVIHRQAYDSHPQGIPGQSPLFPHSDSGQDEFHFPILFQPVLQKASWAGTFAVPLESPAVWIITGLMLG